MTRPTWQDAGVLLGNVLWCGAKRLVCRVGHRDVWWMYDEWMTRRCGRCGAYLGSVQFPDIATNSRG